MKVGTNYYWYHNDHLGTPQMMTTSSGAVVWKAKYTSFGRATVDPSSTVENPLRFPGQYEDAETGLHYNWFRYYQPDIGRYLIDDPIGFWSSINFYAYVDNHPLIFIDPFGLELISAAEGKRIVSKGEKWIGVPYKLGGKDKEGIDCSNFVNKAYGNAGFEYDYLNTKKFTESPRFKKVTEPQAGDVVLLNGHMGIYNPDAPRTDYTLLSATSSKGVRYGKTSWFHGTPTYYRYDKPDEENPCE